MNAKQVARAALLLTLLTVVTVDAGALLGCIALAGARDGVVYFFVGGGPPTLAYSGLMYGWFKRRLSGEERASSCALTLRSSRPPSAAAELKR